MESLHLSFSRVVEARIFTGIEIGSSLTISHLFYADDTVFIWGRWAHNYLKGEHVDRFLILARFVTENQEILLIYFLVAAWTRDVTRYSMLLVGLGFSSLLIRDVIKLARLVQKFRLDAKSKEVLEGVFYVSWWSLWNFRNHLLFADSNPRKDAIFDEIVLRSFNWCLARGNRTLN
ncbi:hypothetical protein Tco_1183480 [Tanacetum coccineum]